MSLFNNFGGNPQVNPLFNMALAMAQLRQRSGYPRNTGPSMSTQQRMQQRRQRMMDRFQKRRGLFGYGMQQQQNQGVPEWQRGLKRLWDAQEAQQRQQQNNMSGIEMLRERFGRG